MRNTRSVVNWLAGDIGATKSDLAVYSSVEGPGRPLAQAILPTAAFPTLAALALAFLSQSKHAVDGAILAVAGPVVAGRVTTTVSHLPWVVDQSQLKANLGLTTIHLINDMEAAAWAILHLTADDYTTLNPGQPVANGALAVIAPGTGLGEAFLIWDSTQYRPYASEGGHASFAPGTPAELEPLRYLQNKLDHVSFEDVCSGIGIPNLYMFLRDSHYAPESSWVAERLAQAGDPTPIIVEAALARPRPCALCAATLKTFISILGNEAGNLAVKVLTTGGIYLAGGLPSRILPLLEQEKAQFLHAFSNKGVMTEVLENMPVHVVTNPHLVRMGAAHRIACLIG